MPDSYVKFKHLKKNSRVAKDNKYYSRYRTIIHFLSVSTDDDRIQKYLEFVGLTNILDRVGMDTETD